MELVSLKITKEELEERREEMSKPVEGPSEMYPWGLSLHLDNDTLEKLGLERLPPAGSKLRLEAKVDVTSVSENKEQSPNGTQKRRNVTLQITAMGLEAAGEAKDPAATLYKG